MTDFLCSLAVFGLLLLLVACTAPGKGIVLPTPLREPISVEAQVTPLPEREATAVLERSRFRATPVVPPLKNIAEMPELTARPELKGQPLTINFESMPLPAFINEVFGNLLGLSFEIDTALQNKKDLVTLRVVDPISPTQLYDLAIQVLNNYGVMVARQGEVLRFVVATGAPMGEVPLLVSGRTLPDVPVTHRPVFQLVPLEVVRNVHVRNWLQQMFKGQNLEIYEDAERNAVLVVGPPQLVAQAVSAIRVLDQPLMRGRYSVRIDPAYRKAEEMANELIQVLAAEGYAASLTPSIGAIIVLPIKATNSILVFSADARVLNHIQQWARELDRLTDQPGEIGLYVYSVQNTAAESLAEVLNQLLGALTGPAERPAEAEQAQPAVAGKRLVVDPVRNALIFQGTGEEWTQLRPVIEEMDKPAKLALIEVTIAEITLNDETQFGIEWAIKEAGIGDFTGDVFTLGGLGIGEGGLNYFILSDAGRTRAVLNAFASSNRVTILSTPRLMVRSGEEASINVGSEIPIITSRSTTPDLQQDGTSAILQEIQYRRTGTLLNIKPVVHAGARVDLEISQEVSEAQPNNISGVDSPIILNRSINTNLSLQDGGAVLLGGLISGNHNRGNSRVPLLGDIPVLGPLFRVDRVSSARTELILIIVPYIISNHEEAQAITEAFRRQLSFE